MELDLKGDQLWTTLTINLCIIQDNYTVFGIEFIQSYLIKSRETLPFGEKNSGAKYNLPPYLVSVTGLNML